MFVLDEMVHFGQITHLDVLRLQWIKAVAFVLLVLFCCPFVCGWICAGPDSICKEWFQV